MTLDDLGARICILGPSNSGKSTLAIAIARARDLPPIHLDQLHHEPGSDWRPRPEAGFFALHDAAIVGGRWVMEGNSSRRLPQRLSRATGLVLLDLPTVTSLARYLRRSCFERDRLGALEGGRDSVRWAMVRHITVATPANRRRPRELFEAVDLPKIALSSARDLARFYRAEDSTRA